MVTKRQMEFYLRKYIRENAKRGHSRKAIKSRLVQHGMDDEYIDQLLSKQQEEIFLRSMAVLSVTLLAAGFVLYYSFYGNEKGVTAYDVFNVPKPQFNFDSSNYFLWLIPLALVSVIAISLLFMRRDN